MAPRDMQSVLTDKQFEDYKRLWNEQRDLREDTKSKPAAVVRYEQLLKEALFEYSKADAQSRARVSGRREIGKQTVGQGFGRATTLFERLIEYLEEQVTADSGLCIWFDRTLYFGADGDIAPDPDRVPRVVTSKSRERRGDGRLAGAQRKREVKMAALEWALNDLDEETARLQRAAEMLKQEDEQARTKALKERLKLLGRR